MNLIKNWQLKTWQNDFKYSIIKYNGVFVACWRRLNEGCGVWGGSGSGKGTVCEIFNSFGIPNIASAMLPTIHAFVSVSPPNEIAVLILSSKELEVKSLPFGELYWVKPQIST